ncbi:MAG: hypothetical protein ACJAYG_001122 [Oceanicoccus sp.]|jgi:hypothetical protein
MKFVADSASILCVRKATVVDTYDDNGSIVARFDARLKEVPPHVESQLTTGEVIRLRKWLLDREKIKQDPSEKNLLELLPELILEGIVAIDELSNINQDTFDKLLLGVGDLHNKLLKSKYKVSKPTTKPGEIGREEANKERLEQVKKNII